MQLLTIKEVAEMIRLSLTHTRRKIDPASDYFDPELFKAVVKIGQRGRRLKKDAVIAWIEGNSL